MHSEKNRLKISKTKLQHFKQNSILEQVKVNKYLKIFLKISEVILGKTDKKKLSHLADFGY